MKRNRRAARTKGLENDPTTRSAILGRASRRYAFALIGLGLIVRLIPAALIYGADDVARWELIAREIDAGNNPYETGFLNWPPLWPALLLYSSRAAGVYGLPLSFTVKLVPIAADIAISLVLYAWFLRRSESAAAFRRALWYALNPVAIYTCAFHGQFDSIPALFTLLAVLSALRSEKEGGSFAPAVWLGLGGFAKTWPLFTLPAFLPDVRPLGRRILFAAIALAPWILAVAALYAADPRATVRYVLSYRSGAGWWGITTPIGLLPERIGALWTHAAQILLYLALLAVAIFTWRRGDVARRACLMILTFYVFTSGFGTQYLLWIVPLALIGDERRARIYSVAAALLLTIEYLFRPYNGTFGRFLASPTQRTAEFFAAYGSRRDMFITCLVRTPLWLFCIGWWWKLLRETGSSEASYAKMEGRE